MNKTLTCPACEHKLTELDQPNHFICNNCEGLFRWDDKTDGLVRI